MYSAELEYINKIILFQEHHYVSNGEIVVLLDQGFPNFKMLEEKKVDELIVLYEENGWGIRKEKIKDRSEYLLIFS